MSISIAEQRYLELVQAETRLKEILEKHPELADGEKITSTAKKYKKALQELRDQVLKVTTCEEFKDIFQVAFIHGITYKGPNLADVLEKTRKLLGK